ncbi:hypothetical protein RhiirA1_416964 [Rhizophagus irregularis]|uniref:Uncharacterized protein n=5 Tax=Rhizophagus irregularis TaxID=588596 RepID=A0A2I1F856_9GLOM|nr:hypothetical protein GLOIN_2v1527478 [Rhizophagus irregularis DAOM 181602=DAOM 197198]PKC68360.1 hypothetical protein RhiirA1_416964 [Rhizophagus irregularis]PKY30561.1 hypothetical protein RhiirB3_418841 [Rhizophagus irregularis]POG79409.1 hypothetical protein GLOIN_2v1527478 [Rhizophagus irregularis DAOM 181602=DAOM 197198]UZO08455.1 hypothetical protein OCT59_028710 [Rhizophagus irregularis]CAB4472842.1 unnamed protein product [Rhizophagus irregularis]|eukprot:XP_025186275.1 hypothetical protein GLOIN_2v1527478 [Rhizophagus irregularis DAOM 181602=DAOM 197198]
MPSRSLHDVPLAAWQWQGPLSRFFLILIIFSWGLFLEFCGSQPDYYPELKYLMNLGSFIVALVVGALAQTTLAHMFAYLQGYFLLKKQGIPLQAIMSGEQTPARVLIACLIIFRRTRYNKQRHGSFFQIISYISVLLIYILSVGIGAYAASKLGEPYIFYNAPIMWAQAPTQGIRDSLLNAFIPENSIDGITVIQYNSLSSWVDKTRGREIEVPFLPQTWTTSTNATASGNLKDKDGLMKWNLELELDNANLQYLTAQCNVNPDPPCNKDQIVRGTTISLMAGKENKTISWKLCDLPRDQGSVQLDCKITLKQGLFPRVTIGFPNNGPRDENLAEVLLRKNELTDLNELTDELFDAMEEAYSRPDYKPDIISNNVIKQLVSGWNCEGNNTCAQRVGASAAVRYTGALLESAANLYPIDYSIELDDYVVNSKSTGFLTATHKVCIGGNNPMLMVGLTISIPLLMMIVELIPLLFNNKVWWLASDIGYKHIALIRSVTNIGFLERTTRPGEIPCQTIVRFNPDDDDHFGLSTYEPSPSKKVLV